MLEQNPYEVYMRSVLGYMPPYNAQEDELYNTNDYYIFNRNMTFENEDNSRLEQFYPDIYRRVYPLICEQCKSVNMEALTDEVIERMVDTVYKTIEVDLKIETRNVKADDRQYNNARNNFLRDLIRILILREIIGGSRPKPQPPRPPFPGGPRPPYSQQIKPR